MTAAPEPPARPPAPASLRLQLLRAAALLFVVALTVAIYVFRDQARQLTHFGYPGVFLLSLLAYATIILPAPGLAVVFTLSGVFDPLGVGLAAGAGAALGELSGYLAGFSGQAVIENRRIFDRFVGWMNRYGPVTITALAIIPSPFFDLAGIAAGALKMPVWRFLLWVWVGQTIKMLIVAYAGAYSIDWIRYLVG